MIKLAEVKCPRCGVGFTDRPALSRKDNKTYICPDCGIREALEAISVPEKEWQPIIDIIHTRANRR